MTSTYLSELRSGSIVTDTNGAVLEVVCDLRNGQVSVRDKGAKRARQVRRENLTEMSDSVRR